MTAAVAIRARGVEALAEVGAVMAAAFDPKWGEAWTEAQVLGMIALPGVVLLTSGSESAGDGAATGFALARVIADEAELLLIAVHPDARRSGTGTALLDAMIGSVRAMGAHLMFLEMRENNPAALLYRRNGFTQVGRRVRYYRGGDGARHDALTFSRAI